MSFFGKARRHLVQTASQWPVSDLGWETRPYWTATSATMSVAGNGSASFNCYSGKIHDPETGQKDFLPLEPSPVGQWVRIIVKDPITGDITIGKDKYRAVWHGICKSRKVVPSAGDLPIVRMTVTASWITAAYEACDILQSYELDAENNVVDSYAPPVFNLIEGGDCSATEYNLDGIDTYVFERGTEATRNRWTYGDAIRYICATARPKIPTSQLSGPPLRPGDIPAALANAPLPAKSGRGRNVMELLRSIINPSVGCCLVFSVNEVYTITVDVRPCAQADMPLWDGSLVQSVLPNPFDGSGATPSNLPIHQDPTLFDCEITESDDAEDYIVAVGGPDIYGMSLRLDEALIPFGWDWTDVPGDPDDDPNGDVFRLFTIDPAWLGEQWDQPGDGLLGTLQFTENGTNGDRTFGGTHPANGTLQFTRDLPWSSTDTANTRSTPKLFLGPASGQTEWEDITSKIPITPLKNGIIRLGQTTKHAEIIKDAYDNNQDVILSIGVENWHPLLVAWRRSSATPRDLPRVRRIDLPQCSTETGLVGTAQLVDPDTGALVKATTQEVNEADLAGLRNALASTQAKAQTNSITVRFRTKGSSVPRQRLGDPILAVTYGKAPNDEEIEVKAIVTSLTFDFSAENFGIIYEAFRMIG